MVTQYTRSEVSTRLRAQIEQGRFVLMQGAGIGLVARCVEDAGVDIIALYNTGVPRMNGWPSIYGTLPIANANDVVLDLGRQILPVVRTTPVIGGVYANDPTREVDTSLRRLKDMGFSGVINVPTVGRIDGSYRTDLESVGISFGKEVDLMRRAIAHDLYTIAYVYNAQDALDMARAGVDMIVAHAGLTGGGDVGAERPMPIDQAVERCNEVFTAVLGERDDVVLLSHGGPIVTPDDAAYVSQRTAAVGFVGASSIERIPVEAAIKQATSAFKQIPMGTDRMGQPT